MVDGWKEVRVDELGEIITGKTPKTSILEYYNGNISFLTPSDDMDVKVVNDTKRTLTEIGVESVSRSLLPEKSICVSCIGSQLGKVVMTARPTVTNQQINSIIPNDNYDTDFIYYSMLILGKTLNYISKTSTAVPIINKSEFSSFSILAPLKHEQKAIAHILSSLDEKIQVNNKINKTLEKMAQEIFKHWFVDFEFPDEEGEPYKSSGGEMVESELGLIPKGWEVINLETIISISSGKRPKLRVSEVSSESEIPLVGASSIMGYTNGFNYDESVLVIGRVGTHGVIQRFHDRIWASDNTLVIKSKYYEYVYQILNSIDYSVLNRGSTQPLITQTDIKAYKVLKSEESLYDKFEELVGKNNRIQIVNKQQNTLLESIRDTLLPKLMSGEIRVPLDNEEQ